MTFKEVAGRYQGPALETEVLEFWREANVFEESTRQSEGRPLFIWNEGPPTANGRPGIHHVLARTFKDIFPRFKHMQGYHCPRKAGWDTHGLPVEHEVEKELGIFDKARIEEEVGVAEFTKRCRDSVMRYIGDWEKMTERMGFWVNLDEAYYTLDNSYIESVWWLLKQLWDKELIYQGYKVVPYDPRIGATLSSHEVAQGYKEVEDPSVFIRFRLLGEDNTSFLVWTTTPWTLPSNLALAVHADVDYAFIESNGEHLILAQSLIETVLRGADYRIEKVVKGAQLEGMKYQRLFDYLPAEGDICQVWTADFVTTEDGTGVVHCAPAYGEDDVKLCQAHGLPVVHGVGLDGNFVAEVEPVAGMFFKDADPVLTKILESRGLMYRAEKFLHNYPHGWRTGDPLIYYAKHAWYIRTSNYRDRMVELNRTINWVPDNIKEGRFGNWLANNVDWALSRERFWGTPLPVWTDDEGDFLCIGSLVELEKLCGRDLTELDLHRPAVDEITFTHPDNGRHYHRVPEVIDCWFDSGAMSYAQFHYPFENKESFDDRFPADYICEAIDQTRGWFYSLHAIAALVSNSVAYKNCICLGHVVDGDGKKMSKSVGNIVDPYDVFDTVGADALRWYMSARIAPEVQKRISVDYVREVASTFINTYWNTYAFFVMYARLDEVDLSADVALAKRPEIDRWVLALLHDTVERATHALETYDAQGAGQAIESFIDQLSNWYVRRNRRRFWKAAAGDDKQSAYLTLYECLHVVTRLMAPMMPFITESVYHNLSDVEADAPISVHMADWPKVDASKVDAGLIFEFDVVQRVVGLGRTARNNTKLKVRQPLPRLLVRVPDSQAAGAVQNHQVQILEELNVKRLELIARDAELINYRIKPNLPRIGKRYGKLIPAIRTALAAADGGQIAAAVAAGQAFSLEAGGQTLSFEAQDVLVESESAQGYASAEEAGFLVGLDTRLNDELRAEGLAREVVRSVQDARKQAGLEVSDRITLRVSGSAGVQDAIDTHRDFIMSETLATNWGDDAFVGDYVVEHDVDGESWTIKLSRTPARSLHEERP
jgi:isoleucyl-tRNA synthetase